MSSRFSAARPKRAGESYARQHHGGDGEPDSKKVKFDVRNPSALAPDADDEDEDATDVFLEADADVIRGGATAKRGAVNIDGYDSDSDREEMGALRTNSSKKGKEVDMDDMFADEDEEGDEKDDAVDDTTGKKSKEVRFLDAEQIEGQEATSRSGGQVRLDEESSSDDDEEAVELAIQEEGLDEEAGLGGLKKHAPKVEAFNLKAEQEEGRFDESGNYVRKAADPDAVHDRWLEGVSKRDMRRAAEAHERREEELRQRRRADDGLLTSDLLRALILQLERGETPEDALRRLGRRQAKSKAKKKVPKWKQKKQQQKNDAMEVDANTEKREETEEDREQARIKEAIDAITDAASKLLERDRPEIYDWERERLVREYGREADEPWVEPRQQEGNEGNGAGSGDDGDAPAASAGLKKMWEFRWTDGRDDAAKQGPFDGPTMKAWQDAGYFGEGVEFREVDGDEGWTRVVSFV